MVYLYEFQEQNPLWQKSEQWLSLGVVVTGRCMREEASGGWKWSVFWCWDSGYTNVYLCKIHQTVYLKFVYLTVYKVIPQFQKLAKILFHYCTVSLCQALLTLEPLKLM